jgi:hypothetical protein
MSRSIDAVDLDAHRVYFSGNYGNACEKHLCSASFLPAATAVEAKLMQLTQEPGWHQCAVNLQRGVVADSYSSITCPLTLRVCTLDKAAQTLVVDATITDSAKDDARLHSKPGFRESMGTPVLHTIRSTDDKVDLHCAIYLPQGVTFDANAGNEL